MSEFECYVQALPKVIIYVDYNLVSISDRGVGSLTRLCNIKSDPPTPELDM